MTVVVPLCLEATMISAKKDYKYDLTNYVFSLVALNIVSAVFWMILVNSLSEQFEELFLIDIKYINCIIIYCMFYPVVTIFQTWERFIYKYKITVLISIVLAVGVAALSVVMTIVLPDKLNGAIFGRTVPAILIGVALVIWFISKKSKIRIAYWKYAIPISLPYIPHLLAITLLGAVNRIFVIQICGAEANGLYSLAYNCGQIISIFVTSLNNAFSPWLGDKLTERDYDSIRRICKPYLLVFGVSVLLISLLAPEILLVLGGESYIEAVYVIPPVAMGCILQFAYCMYVNIEQYEKKTGGMAIASISAALLDILLCSVLIPRYGYIAAAIATAIAYCWLLLVHYCLVRHIGMQNVYNDRLVICASLFFCALVGICSLLYNYIIIRIILIISITISVIIFYLMSKDKIKQII